MKKKNLRIIIILVIIAILAAIFFIYVGTYSPAVPPAPEIAQTMVNVDGNLYLYADSDTGIIIYPGGKVDEQAYAPLAQTLYEGGYTVAIVKMPFHLSIFDSNKAVEIIEQNPQIKYWVIVGHSLGGTSASIFAHDYPENLSGIVFLGSYPYKDLSGLDLWALDISGSNDLVLDREKAAEYTAYYPTHSSHEVIVGGNHAGFGCYGVQSGDGQAKIAWEAQVEATAQLILDAMTTSQ